MLYYIIFISILISIFFSFFLSLLIVCDGNRWYLGTRHGLGICLYADGTMYEGHWYHGREHGTGSLMTGDRQKIYVGDWMEGYIQGQGTYYFLNGDRYTGRKW